MKKEKKRNCEISPTLEMRHRKDQELAQSVIANRRKS